MDVVDGAGKSDGYERHISRTSGCEEQIVMLLVDFLLPLPDDLSAEALFEAIRRSNVPVCPYCCGDRIARVKKSGRRLMQSRSMSLLSRNSEHRI